MTKKKIKKFKSLFNKEPTPIYQTPVHGAHAHAGVAEEDEDIQEATEKKTTDEYLDSVNANSHIGNDIDDVHNHLTKNHENHYNSLTHDEKMAISHYTSSSYGMNEGLINNHKTQTHWELSPEHKALIDKHGIEQLPYGADERWEHDSALKRYHSNNHNKSKTEHLDSALKKGAGQRDKDLYVYHGLKGWHPGQESAKHPDRHVQLPAYTSTSIDPQTAQGFGGQKPHKAGSKTVQTHMLKIHVKPEHHGMYLGDNSVHTGEKEFLVPRGVKLKIHPKPEIFHNGGTYKNYNPGMPDHNKEMKWKTRLNVWHAEIIGHHDDDK